MKVVIASKNPVKIKAVAIAFQKMFPKESFHFDSLSVPSGVNDQPMSNNETLEGAINRTANVKAQLTEADYWVGIEGGIEKANEDMEAFAWVVIKSTKQEGKARTATFFLPPQVIWLINEGKELGEADDIIFGDNNSKQKNGAVGLLTHNIIDRTKYYTDAVILALIPFKNPKLYRS